MTKQYIAIYDEVKLFSDFFHNNLERIHEYHVLFSTDNETELFRFLTDEVRLLLIGASREKQNNFSIITSILKNFKEIKILIYTRESLEALNENLSGSERIKIISGTKGSSKFFEAIEELLPNHKNHSPKNNQVNGIQIQFSCDAFERIRNNRKKIFILQCIEDGLHPKEMSDKVGLTVNTINTYIERMMEDTGCRTQTVLVLQSKKLGII